MNSSDEIKIDNLHFSTEADIDAFLERLERMRDPIVSEYQEDNHAQQIVDALQRIATSLERFYDEFSKLNLHQLPQNRDIKP